MEIIVDKEKIAEKAFFIREENSAQPIMVIKVGDLMANGVQLPEGHGELKDANELKDIIKKNHYLLSAKNNSTDYGMFTTGIMQAIDSVEPAVSADNPSPDVLLGSMR